MKPHFSLGFLLALSLLSATSALAQNTCMPDTAQAVAITEFHSLVGQSVDVSPWAYLWRADRAVQEKPEACFIPRRLARIDKVYRTAKTALPPDQLKSLYYKLPDLLKTLPPPPKGKLQTGLLWTGRVNDYRVELKWPADAKEIPPPDAIEVRVYPTSFGWFGWTVDKILTKPEISADRRTWTYKSDPTEQIDTSYDGRVPAATEMIAVFYGKEKTSAIPSIRVTSPHVGVWKRMDVEIEWGFQPGDEKSDFEGRLETHVARVGAVAALPGDTTTVANGATWRSCGAAARRGVVVPVLYASGNCPGLDSRVTVWTKTGGFTFRVSDLEKASMLIPGQGVFVTKAGSGQSGRAYAKELAAKNLKSVRQMTREHREAGSWKELMQEVRLWTCPAGTVLKPFPKVPDPPMQVEVSDADWTAAWRAISHQLQGPHMWGGLAYEVGRVAHEMDMIGLHAEADGVYQHFLKSPGVKSDGDFSDGRGSLEWAAAMRHDMGYSHDGTHASTGRLLFAMAERFFLTGDRAWFERNRARLQAAADWIIRQRRDYMKDVSNRDQLHVAGLMPPSMIGDYAIPTCDWHWYYVANVLDLQGLHRFADALSQIDPPAGQKYREEAEAFRKDIRRTAEREAALAPVRLGRDGMYHSYLPRMAYSAGLTGPEIGAPQFPENDLFLSAMPLSEPFGVLDANDPRMIDELDVVEELGTSVDAVRKREEERKTKGLPANDAWFWHTYVILPKGSHNANIFLLQDDVPNFLRFFLNAYASMVGADGKLWEHWHLGNFDPCAAPDNGTAGWVMENFRNMLVMEQGDSLWIARATPRAWLEQGKKIAIRNAPTCFGTTAYSIVSDAAHGRIAANIELPSRTPPKEVLLRLRHPKATPIKSVTVNGQACSDFDPAKEVVRLHDLKGEVKVEARY